MDFFKVMILHCNVAMTYYVICGVGKRTDWHISRKCSVLWEKTQFSVVTVGCTYSDHCPFNGLCMPYKGINVSQYVQFVVKEPSDALQSY